MILDAYRSGCLYDAWSEYFHFDRWLAAFEQNQIDPLFYNGRERPYEEILPWDFIDCGVSREFLWREYCQAKSETVTPNCRERCSGCGARQFEGGVCYEGQA